MNKRQFPAYAVVDPDGYCVGASKCCPRHALDAGVTYLLNTGQDVSVMADGRRRDLWCMACTARYARAVIDRPAGVERSRPAQVLVGGLMDLRPDLWPAPIMGRVQLANAPGAVRVLH